MQCRGAAVTGCVRVVLRAGMVVRDSRPVLSFASYHERAEDAGCEEAVARGPAICKKW